LSQLADAVVVPVSLVKGAQAEIDVTDSAASAIAEMIRIVTSLRHHEMEISLSNAEYRLDRWKARFDRSYRRSVSSMGRMYIERKEKSHFDRKHSNRHFSSQQSVEQINRLNCVRRFVRPF
jgi:hypothetical protein